jgi:hypothetical protein
MKSCIRKGDNTMPKEYIFEFQGTKEMFLDRLNQFPNNDGKFYFFNDYIVKLVGDEIHFGVERGGHSGGYWFIPIITEFDNQIEFRGTVQYIDPNTNQGAIKKAIDKVGEFLLLILILPIVLVIKLYTIIKWCIRKVCKRPKPRVRTTEDKLYELMENHLNCIRV